MDVVVAQGDKLIIEIDVIDAVDEPFDLTDAEVRYVVSGEKDFTEDSTEIELVEVNSVTSRLRISYDIDFDAGRYEHECKIQKDSTGPAAILPRSMLYVEASLIGETMNP